MKKTYIIPTTVVVMLGAQRMLASSDGSLSKSGDNYTGTLINTNATSDGLAKGVSDVNVWDEEW